MKKIVALTVSMAVFFLAGVYDAQAGAMAEDMKPVLEHAKARLNEWFKILDNDLANAARRLSTMDLKGSDARKILKELMIGRSSIINCAIVDDSGKMVTVQPPEYRSYEGKDISKEPHIITLLETKMPVMSNSFISIENVHSIAFEYPIFSDSGQFRGAVSIIIKYAVYFDYLLAKMVRDLPCKIWVMQPDGLILYDQDPTQISRNIFTDDMFRPFQGLIDFSKGVASEKNGAGSYDFYTKGLEDKTVVKKDAIWDTVGIYGNEWRVVAMEIEK